MSKDNKPNCHNCYYYRARTDKVFQCEISGMWYSENKKQVCEHYKKKRL